MKKALLEQNNTNDSNGLNDDAEFEYSNDDIGYLMTLLSSKRYFDPENLINVGMCLYNINKSFLLLWKIFSSKNDQYDENECEQKWNEFSRKRNRKLSIRDLLYWCKSDDIQNYNIFVRKKKIENIICNKFQNQQLKCGETKLINSMYRYTFLNNNKCIISDNVHYYNNNPINTMYVEMLNDNIMIKCKHSLCFGRIFQNAVKRLNSYEMDIIFESDETSEIVDDTNNFDLTDNCLSFLKEHKLFDSDQMKILISEGLFGKELCFANLIEEMYKGDYVYVNKNVWYKYKNHRWHLSNKHDGDMKKKFILGIKNVYTSTKDYLLASNQDNTTLELINAVQNVLAKLNCHQFVSNIMKEIIYYFEDSDFVDKLNTNQYLIGFNNGVYDLKMHEFRDGRKDDYISLCTYYDYDDTYKNKQNLLDLLSKIQPNDIERDKLLMHLASALYKKTNDLLVSLIQIPHNVKMILMELISITFGNYYGSVKDDILCENLSVLHAPIILNIRNKKIVAMEYVADSELNNFTVEAFVSESLHRKSIISDSKFFAHQYIMLYFCKKKPELNIDITHRCINFESHNDATISDGVFVLHNDFLLLLIEYYKKSQLNIIANVDKNIIHSGVQIEWLSYIKKELGVENIQYAGSDTDQGTKRGKEYRIKNTRYFADGYDAKTNTIFEFQGCYYHGCPRCYSDREKVNDISKLSFGTLYEKTCKKKNKCLEMKYNFIEIWECDWKKYKKDKKLMDEYIQELQNEYANYDQI